MLFVPNMQNVKKRALGKSKGTMLTAISAIVKSQQYIIISQAE
jgi:hypothetical protein